jgi:hypothetical protein
MKIIGFAGKKQSGKNTAVNFILMMKMLEAGICKHAKINSEGKLEISDILGAGLPDTEFILFEPPHVRVEELFDNVLGNHIRLYSFAYKLKQVCIDLFGLTYEQCYGTDENKNTKTKLKWEHMPGVITKKVDWDEEISACAKDVLQYHRRGYMTAREVLQFFGSEICRKIKHDCWTEQLISQIQKETPEIALVSDVRFDNEVKAIQKVGGFVVYLLRNHESADTHVSETGISDTSKCDAVLDNSNMTIPKQNEALYRLLQDKKVTNFRII